MSFPTPFHEVAFKHYDHIENTRDTVIFMLDRLNENQIGVLKNIYLDETTFTRHKELRAKWDSWYEEPLTTTQVNILIFLLNMYCCELAQKKRADDLRKKKI